MALSYSIRECVTHRQSRVQQSNGSVKLKNKIMILGIGNDIVSVERIENLLDKP